MYDPNCLECKLQRHIAQQSSVPDHVLRVFEEAIEDAEGGVTGWLKTINSFRLVKLLTYPARLPYNVVMVRFIFILLSYHVYFSESGVKTECSAASDS